MNIGKKRWLVFDISLSVLFSTLLKKLNVVILSSLASMLVIGQGTADISVISTPDDARSHGLESLSGIEVPLPSNLDDFLTDRDMATKLGKALFHEMAVGSDGIQSCASCHFEGGADSRSQNQLNPDLQRVENDRDGNTKGFHNAASASDTLFEVVTGSPSNIGPNYKLKRSDFPFVTDIGSGDNVVEIGGILHPAPGNSNDVASSMGIMNRQFISANDIDDDDLGTIGPDPLFNVLDVNTRRVEPRNTPTVINAVFNFHNFWDGRANNRCNGKDPFGNTTGSSAKVFVDNGSGIEEESLDLRDSSLCSQALGPPLSHFEMSFVDRNFTNIASKILTRRALQGQKVHRRDSLLASLRYRPDPTTGLTMTYEEMIKAAFKSKYWDSADTVSVEGGPKSLIVANFSFFWGISVMLYEATLVSDKSPFDLWMAGDGSNVRGFGTYEKRGLNIFVNEGNCVACHSGAEFTKASVSHSESGLIEPMLMGDFKPALYDNGFYNIGVTPTTDDIGRGGVGPNNKPLSSSRQFAFQALGLEGGVDFEIIGETIKDLVCNPNDSNADGDPSTCDDGNIGFIDQDFGLGYFEVCNDLDGDGECSTTDELLLTRVAVDGAFKVPTLRNASLTPPYMHNGGLATLMEVVDFYDRGGNFCGTNKDDLDPDIRPLGLSNHQKDDLVAFLISLTDKRAARREAPFDVPSLRLAIGSAGNHLDSPDADLDGEAEDRLITIPAAGKRGGGTYHIPLFLNGVDDYHSRSVKGECSSNSS